jgi:hypothetical protein
MELALIILAVVLIVLWVFSKSVKAISNAAEGRAIVLAREASADNLKRTAKIKIDIDTAIQAAENVALLDAAEIANVEALQRLRGGKHEPA